MKIVFTAKKLTLENSTAVVKLEPSITEGRESDSIAGEIFLTTTEANMVMGMDDTIEIDFAAEIPPE